LGNYKVIDTLKNNKINNLPDFAALGVTLKSYFGTDSAILKGIIEERYSVTSSEIPMLPLRFLNRFINEKASLFSNTFERILSDTADNDNKFSLDELTLAEMWAERYMHLFKQAALQVSFDGEKINFLALDPTMFFYDKYADMWFLKVSEDIVYLYKKETSVHKVGTLSDDEDLNKDDSNIVGEYLTSSVALLTPSPNKSKVIVYKCNTGELNSTLEYSNGTLKTGADFATVLENFEYDRDLAQNGFVATGETLQDFPFVLWNYYRIDSATPNDLADLQTNYISSLSWGLFNVDPKLLTQIVVKSGESESKIRSSLKKFGRTTAIVKLGINDTVDVFDIGDISVLRDLFKTYSEILEQRALQEGVDKNAVVSQLKMESGEAKKVELGYINKARNEFKVPARLFEKQIMEILNKMFGISISYNGIIFRDIEIAPDPLQDIEYANAMLKSKYWTFPQSYAYINKMSVEKAEELIKKEGIEPPDFNLLPTQVGDSIQRIGESRVDEATGREKSNKNKQFSKSKE
jgi:hypothetical protein